ncbi:putative response regulatory protein [Flavobacteriaceae bacterium UJ101]|nr:putative response regulatory protein [Flavobacteriaceae bacterium UJ101]
MKLKTLIIEDEAILRKSLIQKLNSFCADKVEIVHEVGNVHDAVLYLNSHEVDLALMDIRLSDGVSFDIFQQLREINFKIIFITAYDEFAIRAIKLGALDYLLKPIKVSELKESITRVYQNQLETNLTEKQLNYLRGENKSDYIVIKSSSEYQLVRFQDVLYANSEKGYTTFYLKDGSKTISSTNLGEYEKLLPEALFIRTHQSYIVNKDFICKYLKEGVLVLKNDKQIPVSFRKREEVLKRIFKET